MQFGRILNQNLLLNPWLQLNVPDSFKENNPCDVACTRYVRTSQEFQLNVKREAEYLITIDDKILAEERVKSLAKKN